MGRVVIGSKQNCENIKHNPGGKNRQGNDFRFIFETDTRHYGDAFAIYSYFRINGDRGWWFFH